MADLCVCGHEEREHAYDPTESRPVCFGNAMACPCARYRRSPLSAFRGPSVTFTREDAVAWLRGMTDERSGYEMRCAMESIAHDIERGAHVGAAKGGEHG